MSFECDYNVLNDLSMEQNNLFRTLNECLDDLEITIKSATNTADWESKARDYLSEEFNKFKESFNVVNNRCNNINQFLIQAVDLYSSVDSQRYF